MPQRYKILITGSNGMLGTDLCQELEQDYELYGLDVEENPLSAACNFEKGDITDKINVLGIINRIKPDLAIHTAAMTDVDGCERDKDAAYLINTTGTGNVAFACERTGAIMVYISTDFVFDGKKKAPYREDDKPGPLSIYGDSKLKGEEAVAKHLKKHFILRTSWLYGKHGKNFVDTIIAKAKAEKILKVVDDQAGSPTYTKDLAKAIHAFLNKIFMKYKTKDTGYGIYHVSNSGSASWYEYAKQALTLAGEKAKVLSISSKELDRPAVRPAISVLDNTKFTGFTGHRLRNWKEALEEYIISERGR
jgi:dTDP-4-dehydrorhamnose reductase